MVEDIQQAIAKAYRFTDERFPNATTVLLGGSWASGLAHSDSDLDIVVFDDTAGDVSFEGVEYQGTIVEVCVVPPKKAEEFFLGSTKYRSAPIPYQVAMGMLVKGDAAIADKMRRSAEDALAKGPMPLTESERLELSYDITCLRNDLAHASIATIPSLAAIAHTQLSLAVLDIEGGWRAKRKALRRAVATIDAEFAAQLDDALVNACSGDNQPMVDLCTWMIDRLGGPCRTYPKFSA
jgi:hypothetical protein